VRIGRAAEGIAGRLVAAQGRAHGASNIEAGTVAAEIAELRPTAIAVHLIDGVEALPHDQAGGQAEGHGGVVGPLPRLQLEWTAADDVREQREAAARREFHGRADGVADGQPEQAAAKTVEFVGCRRQGERPSTSWLMIRLHRQEPRSLSNDRRSRILTECRMFLYCSHRWSSKPARFLTSWIG
jgi:hypothetical protein